MDRWSIALIMKYHASKTLGRSCYHRYFSANACRPVLVLMNSRPSLIAGVAKHSPARLLTASCSHGATALSTPRCIPD
jgi:hypothetical protein